MDATRGRRVCAKAPARIAEGDAETGDAPPAQANTGGAASARVGTMANASRAGWSLTDGRQWRSVS
jgi:hypothetical protein